MVVRFSFFRMDLCATIQREDRINRKTYGTNVHLLPINNYTDCYHNSIPATSPRVGNRLICNQLVVKYLS